MTVVRQWMTNYFKPTVAFHRVLALLCLVTLASCNPTEITSSGQRAKSYFGGEMVNHAYIYRESPAILAGKGYGPDADMKSFVDNSMPEFITDKTLLKGDCSVNLLGNIVSVSDCLHTFASISASQQLLPRKSDGTWIFPTNSSEFYQVNGHYHVQHGINTFYEKLKFTYDNLHSNPSFSAATKSTPYYLPQTKLFWFQASNPTNDNYFRNSFLSNYALCNFELNAQFNPAGPDLCFGKWSEHSSFFFVQDPSVVYHELGHALIAVMMNFRNGVPGSLATDFHPLRSNLGSYGYSEAGSIGEGVADYYSFVMTKRTHFAEWALGKPLGATRPMTEDDPLHIQGIDTTSEGRLSYPQYILYDPNQPNTPIEDVHYAGQIISHYLVALTKSLQNQCSISTVDKHDISTSYVMMLLAETFSEMGDLKSIGFDAKTGAARNPSSYIYRLNNLDEFSSYMWSHVINPPNYRKFAQIMAKNISKYISSTLCQEFDQNESEKLLDDYGLLLFKTYNDNNTSTKYPGIRLKENNNLNFNDDFTTTALAPLPINEGNRRKTVLVSKQQLSLALPSTEKDIASYYIIDDQASIARNLQQLLFKGYPISPSTGVAGVEYNNSNIRISPGEIVAIIPNLQNSSNSTMAGVQLLATDWDHVNITDTSGINGNFDPCVIDTVTTTAQGAEAAATCTTTMNTFKRHIKTAGLFAQEAAAPVCLVQLEDGEVTRWVSQNEFRKKQGLSLQDKDCLGFAGTAYTEDFTFNPHECLVRTLPGANAAFYSKIDAQKSYAETIRTGNPDHIYDPGNAILFEINKWIPPGTKFRCRMRAKFSNCSDCFSSPTDSTNDDYVDAEYNGAKPYQIINLEFNVND